MTTTTLHPLAAGYLDDLRRAGRRLPRSAMRDLLAEIEAHLAETTDADMSDAEVFTALDRLGDPKDIVAAQQPEFALPPRVRGIHEWAAIFLILFGGFIFGVGWIAGLVLLWSSPLWSTRDKLIGTLIVPGGLTGSVYFGLFFVVFRSYTGGGPSTSTRVLAIGVLVIVLLAPIVTAIYLARRAR